MSRKMKNITFSLPEEYIEKLRKLAKQKVIPSMNGGVKKALEVLFTDIEKEQLALMYKQAANDPMFINDVNETMNAYINADYDESVGNEDW